MISVFIAVLLMSATGTLLVLCLSILCPVTKKSLSATWHYRMYMLVVLFLLIPVGVLGGSLLANIQATFNQQLPNVPIIINDMMTVQQTDILPQTTGQILSQTDPIAATPATLIINIKTILSFLPLLWLVGAFAFMLWHGLQLVRFKRKIMRTSLQIEDTATLAVFEALMNEKHIMGKLRLFSNSIVKAPMLIGLFKTYLVLPEIEMSDKELAIILKHELIHFKRRDLWIKSFTLVANAIHWFNPAVYRLTKNIDTFCELSCDEQVVSDMNMEERQFYGETILNVICRVVSQHSGVYATLAESKKGIERRLANMMNYKKASKKVTVVALVLMVALALTGFLTACTLNPSAPSPSGNAEGIVLDGIDVPDSVLEEAKTLVAQWYEISKSEYPDYNYSNWRIERLEYVYTYDDFDGMTIPVYQMNYEFFSKSPKNVMVVGGMYVTEDGWVMPGYPNSIFLFFKQDNDRLVFLHNRMENDCVPGDEIFTEDLRRDLESAEDIILGTIDNEGGILIEDNVAIYVIGRKAVHMTIDGYNAWVAAGENEADVYDFAERVIYTPIGKGPDEQMYMRIDDYKAWAAAGENDADVYNFAEKFSEID